MVEAVPSGGPAHGTTARGIWARRLWALMTAMVPTILIFLVVGPLVGYFAIITPVALTAVEGPFGPLEGMISALALLPFGGLFAYMLGYVPAVVTGFAVALVDCITDLGSYRTPAAIVLGASVTLILLFSIGVGDASAGEMVEGFGAVAGSVGAIAGGVCAMIAPRRVPSWPSA